MKNLNEKVSLLIQQGVITNPPEGVRFSNYEIMVQTATERNWIYPTIEQLNSVEQEINLTQEKINFIQHYSNMSFLIRQQYVQDYQLTNAALGVYDDQECFRIKNICKSFRDEFYRLKGLVEACTTIEELNLIEDNYNQIASQI